MSTNYYWIPPGHRSEPKTCAHCGHIEHPSDPPHIGKSFIGWVFSLHVGFTLDLNDGERVAVNDLADWQRLWPRGMILSDCGVPMTPEDMLREITQRSGVDFIPQRHPGDMVWDPRVQLYRSRKNGEYTDRILGGGPRTYDLCNYNFS